MPKWFVKKCLLERFSSMGFFLLYVSYAPVDDVLPCKRRLAVTREIRRLVNYMRELNPRKIIIIKVSIFAVVKNTLEKAGFGERINRKRFHLARENGKRALIKHETPRFLSEC
jgi:hypothetical protein